MSILRGGAEDPGHRASAGAWAMVALQALLFLAVAVAAVTPPVGPRLWSSMWAGLALVIVGAVGVIMSGRHLGRALTPLPTPNGQGLAAHGAYRWVRHPMYTALVVICAGVALSSGTPQSWAAVAAIAVFFAVKARLEERHLRVVYPGYAAYAATVGRFVPGLGTMRRGADADAVPRDEAADGGEDRS